MNFKNFKIVKQLKNIKPRLKWLMFSQMQDYKINSKYIDFLISDTPKKVDEDEKRLEEMVRESLVKEFSPKIKDMQSFDLLVDAVVYNLKRKQLAALDSADE